MKIQSPSIERTRASARGFTFTRSPDNHLRITRRTLSRKHYRRDYRASSKLTSDLTPRSLFRDTALPFSPRARAREGRPRTARCAQEALKIRMRGIGEGGGRNEVKLILSPCKRARASSKPDRRYLRPMHFHRLLRSGLEARALAREHCGRISHELDMRAARPAPPPDWINNLHIRAKWITTFVFYMGAPPRAGYGICRLTRTICCVSINSLLTSCVPDNQTSRLLSNEQTGNSCSFVMTTQNRGEQQKHARHN